MVGTGVGVSIDLLLRLLRPLLLVQGGEFFFEFSYFSIYVIRWVGHGDYSSSTPSPGGKSGQVFS